MKQRNMLYTVMEAYYKHGECELKSFVDKVLFGKYLEELQKEYFGPKEEVNLYEESECEYCGKTMQRRNIRKHQENDRSCKEQRGSKVEVKERETELSDTEMKERIKELIREGQRRVGEQEGWGLMAVHVYDEESKKLEKYGF